jgi:cell division protein FtsB
MIRRSWRPYVLAPLIGAAVAVALLCVDGENGVSSLLSLRARTDQLEARLGELQSERNRLLQTVRRLRRDPLVIERLAREKLGMARPGDLVIRLGDPVDEDARSLSD